MTAATKSTEIWDYYTKVRDDVIRVANCNLCDNDLRYTTTVHNLKNHLRLKHKIYVSSNREPRKSRSRKLKNIWAHFDVVDEENKFACCHYCSHRLSFKTTTGNLYVHLKRQHGDMFGEDSAEDVSNSEDTYYEIEYLQDEDSEEDKKDSHDIWSYFERESGGRGRCVVCCDLVTGNVAALTSHLRRKHPKLVADLKQESNTQNDRNEDSDIFSEVLYIQEPPAAEERKKTVVKDRRSTSYSIKPKPTSSSFSRKRSRSPEDDDYPRRRVSQKDKSINRASDDEEIESFGNYVVCLLKKLPRNVSMKVQRDIINLIMNANLSEENDSENLNKIVLDGNVIRTSEGGSYYMISNTKTEVDGKNSSDLISNDTGDVDNNSFSDTLPTNT